MQSKKTNIIISFALFFLFIGSVGWFSAFFFGRLIPSWMELPNSEPHGIVLDSNGNFYCGSKFYGRIQKYDPDGRFGQGFDTKGGTGWGTDFGFHINEADQLCIAVSGISKDNKGSVHLVRVYDHEGKLVRTEKRESDERDYSHKMRNVVNDSERNQYVFRGFLFPRVVKRTPSKDTSIIVSTPVWLWLFQAPFPAFAFFFVSILVIVFLQLKANAAKLSIPTVNLILNREKLPSPRKSIFLVLGILGIVVLLGITIQIGLATCPPLVIFGFLSFLITIVIIMLLTFIFAIASQWRYARLDFKSWKNSIFGTSFKTRYEAGMALRSTKDPLMHKADKLFTKIAVLCLVIWLAMLVLAICVVLYLNHTGA